MSLKNDDILDNWEEIDEEGLNSKLDQIRKDAITTKEPKEYNGNIGIGISSGPMHIIMMPSDDEYRTQYVAPQPKLKILKRPTSGGNQTSIESRPKPPVKTLQQREQEYAQARLRILGSAQSAEESAEQQILNVTKCDLGINSSYCNIQQQEINGEYQQNINISANHVVRTQVGIVRLPNGPDGSNGFTMKR